MKITLKQLNDAVHFRATNVDGNTIDMDGSPEIGGEGKGVRPKQVLLMSMAGCSSIDVVTFLKKMRQPIENLEVEATAEMVDAVPAVFKSVHLHYKIWGDVKPDKAQKVLDMSLGTYCSVSKMIEPTVEITYDFEIINGGE